MSWSPLFPKSRKRLYEFLRENWGFVITERFSLDFRTEVFNLTNTPPVGAPNVVAGSAGFGSITAAGDPRVMQFGLKFNF